MTEHNKVRLLNQGRKYLKNRDPFGIAHLFYVAGRELQTSLAINLAYISAEMEVEASQTLLKGAKLDKLFTESNRND